MKLKINKPRLPTNFVFCEAARLKSDGYYCSLAFLKDGKWIESLELVGALDIEALDV